MTEAALSPPAEQSVPTAPAPPEVSSLRLVLTLAVGGLVCGLLLVLAFQATLPAIQQNKEAAIERAVREVLNAPQRFVALFVHGGKLVAEAPAGVDAKGLERVFLGLDAASRPVGFAMVSGEPGFQDTVRLIFGCDAEGRTLLGMKVLESKETPGLGDKIEKSAPFISQFKGAAAPIVGVKAGDGSGKAEEIDMITGATISSKTVIRIINNKLEKMRPLLEAYGVETGP
ncbi:MAG: FMN-binding protein [Planctomycetes bacterium]|nr:FMN-binding protein [Planctomycetota bacterium]